MILLDYNRFGGDVTLENFAYDVALTVRQAQVYGIAVQRFSGAGTFQGYGVTFSLADPTHYYIYADTSGDGVYADPSEITDTETITQNYAITSMCAISSYGGSTCTPMRRIDIFFKRPEPTAYVSASSDGSAPVSCLQNPQTACRYEAQITLVSPKGSTRTIIVDSTGQISVQQ